MRVLEKTVLKKNVKVLIKDMKKIMKPESL